MEHWLTLLTISNTGGQGETGSTHKIAKTEQTVTDLEGALHWSRSPRIQAHQLPDSPLHAFQHLALMSLPDHGEEGTNGPKGKGPRRSLLSPLSRRSTRSSPSINGTTNIIRGLWSRRCSGTPDVSPWCFFYRLRVTSSHVG